MPFFAIVKTDFPHFCVLRTTRYIAFASHFVPTKFHSWRRFLEYLQRLGHFLKNCIPLCGGTKKLLQNWLTSRKTKMYHENVFMWCENVFKEIYRGFRWFYPWKMWRNAISREFEALQHEVTPSSTKSKAERSKASLVMHWWRCMAPKENVELREANHKWKKEAVKKESTKKGRPQSANP